MGIARPLEELRQMGESLDARNELYAEVEGIIVDLAELLLSVRASKVAEERLRLNGISFPRSKRKERDA